MSSFPGVAIRRFDDLLLGFDHNRLEVLASANTTRAAASTGAIVFIDPASKLDEFLTCWTDRDDGQIFLTVFFLEEFDRIMNTLAPHFRRVEQI